MLKSKPNRPSNVYGKNVRIELSDNCIKIYYTLANGREAFWEIPSDTDFEPPEWFEDGCSFEAWTINRSTSRSYTDYDWAWIEPLNRHEPVKSKLADKIRARNNPGFNSLFLDQ